MSESKPLKFLAYTTRGLVAVIVVAIGVVAYIALVTTKPKPEPADPQRTLPRVAVVEAAPVPVARRWQGFGTAAASTAVDVPARVTATVDEIPDNIDAGRTVTKGQLLVRLDATDFEREAQVAQQRLDEIEASLSLITVESKRLAERLALEEKEVAIAADEVARLRELAKVDASNTREINAALNTQYVRERAKLTTAEAIDKLGPREKQLLAQKYALRTQLDIANQNVERTRIVSPIDGVIQTMDLKVGEQVSAGTPVARVVDPTRIEVPISIEAGARSHVRVGDPVMLQPTNRTVAQWHAAVARIAPEDHTQTRTVTVFAELVQPAEDVGNGKPVVAPGMFLEAHVVTQTVEQRWIVPRRAIRNNEVLIVEDGIARLRRVKAEFVIEASIEQYDVPDDQWAVLAEDEPGIRAGDLVVVNGSVAVDDGDEVRPLIRTAGARPEGDGVAGTTAESPASDDADEHDVAPDNVGSPRAAVDSDTPPTEVVP